MKDIEKEAPVDVQIIPAGDVTQTDIVDAETVLQCLKQFVSKNLISKVDFGTIPGCGNKPVLLKPGAEKLCRLFKLRPTFVIVDKIVDFDRQIFYYHYKCILYRNGEMVGECEAVAHSQESKFTRNAPAKCPKCENEGSIFKDKNTGDFYCWAKKGGCGAKGMKPSEITVPSKKVFDMNAVNTLMKMAEKRAMVGAVLFVCGASEFFTADLEDNARF